jgi:hypothetical protein
LWHMHDVAPAHFTHAVWDVHNNTYHEWQIGRGGPTAWPTCLSDLNPVEFYLWGHLKALLYAAPVDSEEPLHHHIVDACQTISSSPGIFEWTWQSMMRHVEVWIEFHGGRFEHVL